MAVELLADDNQVKIYTFPEAVATDEFYQKMMDDWRNDKEVEFPEAHMVTERGLNIADSLLPESIKVERSDLPSKRQGFSSGMASLPDQEKPLGEDPPGL